MAPKRRSQTKEAPSKKQKSDACSVGQQCPDFEVETHEGDTLTLKDIVSEAGAVLFAYPKANTPGCTKQACGFRDNFEKIKSAGYQVFGISADKPTPQKNWRTKHEMPFTLLCDTSKKALTSLGFVVGGSLKRSHVVIGKGGGVEVHKVGVSPADSVSQVTTYCVGKGQEGAQEDSEGADEKADKDATGGEEKQEKVAKETLAETTADGKEAESTVQVEEEGDVAEEKAVDDGKQASESDAQLNGATDANEADKDGAAEKDE